MKTPIRSDGPTPKLLDVKPQVKMYRRGSNRIDFCLKCGHWDECHERQRLGLWVLCEIPDSLDMQLFENSVAFMDEIGN